VFSACCGELETRTEQALTPRCAGHQLPAKRRTSEWVSANVPKGEPKVNNNGSLYERIGGENAVTAAVGLLYQKILADETLRHFFAGLNMQAQVKKQVSFMTLAFGGPAGYSGKDLREAHARLVPAA
jgi:hypothetical protein